MQRNYTTAQKGRRNGAEEKEGTEKRNRQGMNERILSFYHSLYETFQPTGLLQYIKQDNFSHHGIMLPFS